MGSSAGAVADDENEHEEMMRKSGLDKVPGFQNIKTYSWEAQLVNQRVRAGDRTDDIIRAIIRKKHDIEADKEIDTYFAERKQYLDLKKKFG